MEFLDKEAGQFTYKRESLLLHRSHTQSLSVFEALYLMYLRLASNFLCFQGSS